MKSIPYGRQSIDRSDIQEVIRVLKSDFITQGPEVAEFEKNLAEYCGAKYAVAVSSGTAALHLACLSADIENGDEVITSPLTFVASANCILYCGGTPSFADIHINTGCIDPEEIRKKITKRTKAVIPIHFAGYPCDLKDIYDVAKKHKITVVEDAAHALGAKYNNSKIGACEYSDMTIFSFHPVKSITTGEGGAITTNRRELYEKLLALRSHGIHKSKSMAQTYGGWYYEMRSLGFNYRITDIQAALGVSQLKKINGFIARRREIAGIYDAAFRGNPYFDIPMERKTVRSARHIYNIRLKGGLKAKRKDIFRILKDNGLGVQVHYIPVYLHPYYKRLGFKGGVCPIAEDYYARSITLPLYHGLKYSEINKVVSTVFKIMKENSRK